MANMDPEVGLQLGRITPSTKSEAETEKETVAPPGPIASVVMLAGRVRAGGVVSWTVTWKDPLAVLAAESVAEQLTVVVPGGKAKPEAGVQEDVTLPSMLSAAVTV